MFEWIFFLPGGCAPRTPRHAERVLVSWLVGWLIDFFFRGAAPPGPPLQALLAPMLLLWAKAQAILLVTSCKHLMDNAFLMIWSPKKGCKVLGPLQEAEIRCASIWIGPRGC